MLTGKDKCPLCGSSLRDMSTKNINIIHCLSCSYEQRYWREHEKRTEAEIS